MNVIFVGFVCAALGLFAGYFFRPAFDKWIEKVNKKAN